MRRWQVVAALLLGLLLYVIQLNPSFPYRSTILETIYEPSDFQEVRQYVSSLIPIDNKIEVTYMPPIVWPITATRSMENGYLLTLDQPITIHAKESGIVYFTGHTKDLGAIIRVKYDSGQDVTYGFLSEIKVLPYSLLQPNDLIGMKVAGDIYIEVEDEDKHYTYEQIEAWLHNGD